MAVVISSILRMSIASSVSNTSNNNIRERVVCPQLTNKVLLPGAYVQRDEADHANQRGRQTEHESKVDGRLVVLALDVWEEEEREGID